jgi:DNA-directed RNA polymerase subunit RPC12/RpoP
MPDGQYRANTPWTCPTCKRDLRIRHWYLRFASWSALGITCVLSFMLGLNAIQFVIVLLIGLYAIYLVLRLVLNLAVPTPLERFPPEDSKAIDPSTGRPPSPSAPLYRCPSCHSFFRYDYDRDKPIICPKCGRQMMVPLWFKNVAFYCAVGFAFTFSLLFGLRDFWLLVGTALLTFPVLMAWLTLLNRIVPAPLADYLPNETTLFPK